MDLYERVQYAKVRAQVRDYEEDIDHLRRDRGVDTERIAHVRALMAEVAASMGWRERRLDGLFARQHLIASMKAHDETLSGLNRNVRMRDRHIEITEGCIDRLLRAYAVARPDFPIDDEEAQKDYLRRLRDEMGRR